MFKTRIKFRRSKPRLCILVIRKLSPRKHNSLKKHRKLNRQKINNLKSTNKKIKINYEVCPYLGPRTAPFFGPCNIRDPRDVYKGMTFNKSISGVSYSQQNPMSVAVFFVDPPKSK
jgi:hypothetical protein